MDKNLTLAELFEHLDSIVRDDEIGLGDNFDDLYDVEDTYDYTDGTREVDTAMWNVTAERFMDINKVDEGACGVTVARQDVEDSASWLMQDVAGAVQVFVNSAWLPSTADVNLMDNIYIDEIWYPTAELDS